LTERLTKLQWQSDFVEASKYSCCHMIFLEPTVVTNMHIFNFNLLETESKNKKKLGMITVWLGHA